MRGVFPVCAYRASTPSLADRQMPYRFFVYIGFVIGRKPSFVINGKNKKDMPAFSSKQSCDLLENTSLGCIAIQSRNHPAGHLLWYSFLLLCI